MSGPSALVCGVLWGSLLSVISNTPALLWCSVGFIIGGYVRYSTFSVWCFLGQVIGVMSGTPALVWPFMGLIISSYVQYSSFIVVFCEAHYKLLCPILHV